MNIIFPRRFCSVLVVVTISLSSACADVSPVSPGASGASFAKGGNSDAAHACQQGGYALLMGSDGTLFSNTGECVSYAAQGGTLIPIPLTPPVINSITFVGVAGCDNPPGHYEFVASFSGGTGVVTGGVGEVSAGTPFPVTVVPFTLTVTNAQGVSVSSTFNWGFATPGCDVGV